LRVILNKISKNCFVLRVEWTRLNRIQSIVEQSLLLYEFVLDFGETAGVQNDGTTQMTVLEIVDFLTSWKFTELIGEMCGWIYEVQPRCQHLIYSCQGCCLTLQICGWTVD